MIELNTITTENVNDIQNRPIITDNVVNLESKNTVITVDVVKDNGDIIGYTTENVKALYKYDSNKWYFGKDIGKCNLVNLASRTEEERKKLGSLGGLKAKENREQKKDFNNLAKSMLEVALSESQAKKLLSVDELPSFIDTDNLNVGAVMIAKGIQECIENGSFKWFESIRDTAGYKPKNEMEIQADVMTESDRMLLDKVAKRIEKTS